jgi:hypothetical protein
MEDRKGRSIELSIYSWGLAWPQRPRWPKELFPWATTCRLGAYLPSLGVTAGSLNLHPRDRIAGQDLFGPI